MVIRECVVVDVLVVENFVIGVLGVLDWDFLNGIFIFKCLLEGIIVESISLFFFVFEFVKFLFFLLVGSDCEKC